jgi:hypothetical protein
MISCDDCDEIEESSVKKFFTNKAAAGFYEWHDWSAEKGLERLVFQVSKKSSTLEAHMERIYYCFQNLLDEQLVGALVDLLIVLNKNGLALGKRMVDGSRSRLPENQYQALLSHLANSAADNDLLPTNRYSIFAKGLLATAKLLHLNDTSTEEKRDALDLARDYIEFSQLDDAIRVLEQAILEQPERMELHNELLSLFRSTRDQIGFKRVFNELSSSTLSLPPDWGQLNDFFGKT